MQQGPWHRSDPVLAGNEGMIHQAHDKSMQRERMPVRTVYRCRCVARSTLDGWEPDILCPHHGEIAVSTQIQAGRDRLTEVVAK